MEQYSSTTTSSTNNSTEDYVQQVLEDTRKMMAPAVTFLLILALVGLCGNPLILVVYWKKFHLLNPTKVLIMTIAGVDLVANIGAIPAEVYRMFHYWNFTSSSLCQATVFLNVFTTVSGATSLLALAVVRYRKVCAPFGWQVTLKQAKFVSVVVIILGACFSIPHTVLYGRSSVETSCYKIKGYECYYDDSFKSTYWPKITSVFFVSLYFLHIIPLIVLYTLIGLKATGRQGVQTVCNERSRSAHNYNPPSSPRCSITGDHVAPATTNQHSLTELVDSLTTQDALIDNEDSKSCIGNERDRQASLITSNSTPIGNSKNEATGETPEYLTTASGVEVSAITKTETCKLLRSPVEINTPRAVGMTNAAAFENKIIDITVMEDSEDKCDDAGKKELNIDSPGKALNPSFQNENKSMINRLNQQNISPLSGRSNTKRRSLGHMTAMLITISATYVLSYLPYLILSLFREVWKDKFLGMCMTELSFYHLFLRLYYLNSAANPVVYSLCDRKFRRECLNLFKRK